MSGKLLVCLLISITLQPAVSPYRDSLQRYEFQQLEMGTLFRVVLYAPDPDSARRIARNVFRRIEQIDARLSDYRSDSELNQLVEGRGPRVVSHDLFRVLRESLHFSRLSGGAFDVTVRPLIELWRMASKRGQVPRPAELSAARQRIGSGKIDLNFMLRSVRVSEGTEIDLGGIAKGFAADEALAVLGESGLTRVLVDAGGDIRVGDPPPGRAGWNVRIEGDPQADLLLSNAAVASSGDLHRYFEIDGLRYSHIIDPRSGRPVQKGRLVTVVASDAMTADGLATALSVMTPQEARALLEKIPGTAARISSRNERVVVLSPGMVDPFAESPRPIPGKGKP